MNYEFKVDGVPIKSPYSFRIEKYNITKSGRIASGKMTMDLVAKKRKFILKWDVMADEELQKILAVVDSDKMFFVFEYQEGNINKSAICYNGDVGQDVGRPGDRWFWKDQELHFIEQ